MDILGDIPDLEEEKEGSIIKVVFSGQSQGGDADLKMILMNSSLGHAYAQLEHDTTDCMMKREELSIKMDALRKTYFHIRRKLWKDNPEMVLTLEEELAVQKQEFFKPERCM